MKIIPLTQGRVTLVDDEDYEFLARFKWRVIITRNKEYAIHSRNSRMMHRFLLSVLCGLDVDHINGNGLDNQRHNLRACTHARNRQNQNKYSNNKSGYKGVSFRSECGKWRAAIACFGKDKYLGMFDSPEAAHAAYVTAAKALHAEFYRP